MPDQFGIPTHAERFAEALNLKFPVVNDYDEVYAVVEGKRFDKIVKQDQEGGSKSVHAFVERHTGLLIKAAGWSAPAKLSSGEFNSRYNLSEEIDFGLAVSDADPFGSYLYAR